MKVNPEKLYGVLAKKQQEYNRLDPEQRSFFENRVSPALADQIFDKIRLLAFLLSQSRQGLSTYEEQQQDFSTATTISRIGLLHMAIRKFRKNNRS